VDKSVTVRSIFLQGWKDGGGMEVAQAVVGVGGGLTRGV